MSNVITYERSTRRLSIDADKTTTLNEHFASVLRNALVVAAEKFDANAAEFDGLARQDPPPEARLPLVPYGAAAKPLAAQFRKQAEETRHLIGLIDGDDEAERDTAILFVAEGL